VLFQNTGEKNCLCLLLSVFLSLEVRPCVQDGVRARIFLKRALRPYTLDINKSGAPFDGIFKKRGATRQKTLESRRKENIHWCRERERAAYISLSHLPAQRAKTGGYLKINNERG
jgi:hypothetical protein